MPFHPYRKVESKYYDLRKLYDWLKVKHAARDGDRVELRPMRDWIGGSGAEAGGWLGYWFTVAAIVPEGVIVEENTWSRNGTTIKDPILLKNYPLKSAMVDGDKIEFLAIRSGNYEWSNRTIAAYDYGIPYNPWAQTNSPPSH